MVDIVDKKTRSRMMSGIKGKNTRPELVIRQALHRLGYRYKLHDKKLPGKPDIVFVSRKAIILVHGCFWHRHDCHLFKWPSTRPDFWRTKINRNQKRDKETEKALASSGWRILVIWECALKGRTKKPIQQTISTVSEWLDSGKINKEIQGEQ